MKAKLVKKAPGRGRVFLFAFVFNEQWFLPHLLAHYRALGIEEFVFYDDRSTDGTRDLLSAQPDCTIFAPIGERGTTPDAMPIQALLSNIFPEAVGQGRWALTVDADEFLLLPRPFTDLEDLVDHLERIDALCAFASMVDFYPRRIRERCFDPLPLFAGSPYFDREPGFVWPKGAARPTILPNGVRARLYRRLHAEHPELEAQIYGKRTYRHARLWKTPLIRTGRGIRRTSVHEVSAIQPRSLQLALAHFKFFPDLDRRLDDVLSRSTHFGGAIEYKFMKAVVDLFADVDLTVPSSVRYASPEDLEDVGLMFMH